MKNPKHGMRVLEHVCRGSGLLPTFVAILAGCGHGPSHEAGGQQVIAEITALPSSHVYYMAVDNSRVVIKSAVSDALVAQRQKVVPLVVAEMKKPSTEFDAFIRLYSVCDQILQGSQPSDRVFWTGGCVVDGEHAEPHFKPGALEDEGGISAFKKAVVDSIEAKIKPGDLGL